MRLRIRGILLEGLKISVLVILFSMIQTEIVQIRHDLHGTTNASCEAQSHYSQELTETRKLIRTALDDSNQQFSQARRVFEESAEVLQDERRELARLIDDRTGSIESTLKERIEKEQSLLENARRDAEMRAAIAQKLEKPIDQDASAMKQRMIYPTVQLRGDGTVGSGVLVYSESQGEERPGREVVTFILTAHHVVMEVMGSKASRGIVEDVRLLSETDSFDPEVFSAELVLFDRDRDAALLRLRSNRKFSSVAEFSARESLQKIDIFTRAYAVGCPLGNRPLPTAGEISSKSKVVGDQVYWMLNAPTFFGNSGGGIYLATNCQLIGISSMIYTYGKASPTVVPHMGLFVPLESIYSWLDAEGFSFIYRREPVPSGLRARLGLPRDHPPAPAKGHPKAVPASAGTGKK